MLLNRSANGRLWQSSSLGESCFRRAVTPNREPDDQHGPVALPYFILLTLGLFAHGSGDAIAGRPHRGVRSIWYAVAHIAGWVLLGFLPLSGIALPEMVGVLALWAWTWQVYRSVTL